MRRRLWQGLIGIALIAAGLVSGVVWSERRGAQKQTASSASTPTGAMPAMPGMPAKAAAPQGDEAVEVSLTPEAIERAGIKTAVVGTQGTASGITVPGTVTTNAYRDTKVNSLVGGVVRQVSADLGASVSRGQPLAVVLSAELADAQVKYLSMQAMLEADHQKLVRSEKLVALGAASRQELEEVTATHAGHATEVAAARQRLLRLGMYVTLDFRTGAGERSIVVPREAVQAVGERSVVYVPVEGDDGRFAERPVKLGAAVGELVQVLEGVKAGERVVTAGSFFLRGEAERSRSGG